MATGWQFESLDPAGLVKVIPPTFHDARGLFRESWNAEAFAGAGIAADWQQENHSRSAPGVLRGLHYQVTKPQGKLVRVIRGAVLDVAVDVRAGSPTFGRHCALQLDADSGTMLWIPPGFAHGFQVLSGEDADLLYLCAGAWRPDDECVLAWDDPALAIPWQRHVDPVVSERDRNGCALSDAPPIVMDAHSG